MDISKASTIISQKLLLWLREAIRLLPNILLAALVCVVGIIISKWIKRLSARLLKDYAPHASLRNLLSSVIYIFFVSVTIFASLTILKLDKAVTSILAGAGIIGLALAFAFQDIASNFISGVFISFRHPIRVGQTVKVRDYLGIVQDITLRDTIIRTFDGQLVIIPNKDVFQNPIENYSMLGKRRYDLPLKIQAPADLNKVRRITIKALDGIDCLSKDEAPTIFFDGVEDGKVKFTVRFWIATPEQSLYLRAGSEAIDNIMTAYEAEGIVLA